MFSFFSPWRCRVCDVLLVLLQDEQSILDKPAGGSAGLREPASLTSSASMANSAFSLAASAFASQDAQLYINGAGYGYRGYASPYCNVF